MLIDKLFQQDHPRTVKAYKNIIGLFLLKIANMATSFIMVPLALNYLDPARYGIWITLTSIFNWFYIFDIGIGNGLRNKVAEALAKNDFLKVRTYISTTYTALTIIFFLVFVIFFSISYFIDWTIILNISKNYNNELNLLVQIIFFFFCVHFVTNLINSIILAKQEPFFVQLITFVGKLFSLIGIYLLTIFTEGSLLYLSSVLAGFPAITTIIFSILFFKTRYKDIKPSIKFIRFFELKPIINLGIKFFILQSAVIVFYQTNNIIITQLFGPTEVTSYNIAFQYFNIATFIFITILTPYWSAFTDAYIKSEIDWIKKSIRNLKIIWVGLLAFVVILYLFSDFLIYFWLGNKVTVQKDLCLVMAIYVVINAFLAIYSHFINGIGKVMIQLYLAIGFAFFHIPLSIYFCNNFGIKGIMFSMILFSFFTVFIYNVQYKKILNKTAKGIWNK